MTKKISIKDLIGKIDPILELEIGGVVYPVLPPNHLPEIHYMRLLQANLDFSEVSEAVGYESMAINDEIKDLSNDPANTQTIRTLSNKLTLVQASLIPSARRAIEAMAQMPDDTLASMPAQVIEKLYAEINEAARAGREEEDEGKEV